MPYFPTTNEEVSQFFRDRDRSPLHISSSERDHPDVQTISVAKMNRILLYEPEEMIVSVQSGISLGRLQQVLAEKNQWIPTLPSSESPEATLGAAIAEDHFHPRSLQCGALRTAILGGTFSTTAGEIFKSGSRVVKSVAGYDIHRAFCGSRGKFGVMLDLTLKVQPLPEMFYRFTAAAEAGNIAAQFHPTCLEENNGTLLIELAGYKEDVLFDIDRLTTIDGTIVELNDEQWADAIKELISVRDKERNISLSSTTNELVADVRRVFDPEGVLI